MTRVFSGIQPSGDVHLGNLLGALRQWTADQSTSDAIYCIVDLHALTVQQDPNRLRTNTRQLAQLLVAIGLDPAQCTVFVQSHVSEHSELSWILECTTSFGELRRMTQFKDKSSSADFVSAGLLTYPALMAADILLYDTDRVPVGDDQKQHLELARDVAQRFNARYGQTFVIPEPAIPNVAARVMDLQRPTDKMSKSSEDASGCILVLEDLKVIEKKVKRAVTDSDNEVRFDPVSKPGVSNLLSILAALTDTSPTEVAQDYEQYGALKSAVAAAVCDFLSPIQQRFALLESDPDLIKTILADGATKAAAIAGPTLSRAQTALGLVERSVSG